MLAVVVGVDGVGATARRAAGRKVIVLGFDGLDYEVTRQLIDAGRLPAFSRLAASGGFSPLGTTIPPQSPVAWSTFITGLDPGEHGIFDFVHRDPKTMEPYLSTTRTEPGAIDRRGPLAVAASVAAAWSRSAWPALLGSARGAWHPDDGDPHAGELSAVGHGHARVERHGHAGSAGRLRHLRDLYVADRTRRTRPRPEAWRIPSRCRDGLLEAALEGPGNPFLKTAREASRAIHRAPRYRGPSCAADRWRRASAC